jgi:hypothetical protein
MDAFEPTRRKTMRKPIWKRRRLAVAGARAVVAAFGRRPRRPLPSQALWNLRHGRAQQMLSVATAASAAPLGLEVFINHYGGSFANKWMWSPIALTPPLVAAGIAGARSERAAHTWLPLFSALLVLNGAVGTYFHGRGIARKPGGFEEASYNLVMGPPLLAPGSLSMVGGIGMLAAIMRRELW